MNIIHIFGTPRSGSTLTQKVLNTSKHTVTLPETWFLLHMYSYRLDHGYNEIGFNATNRGVSSFFENLQSDNEFQVLYESYRNILKQEFTSSYFIEKTPRNIVFIHEIMNAISSEDKVIFVRRDPKKTLESYLDYFDKFPYLKSYKFFNEIKEYNELMKEAIDQYSDRILVIDFELILKKDLSLLGKIRDFLELSDISYENLSNIGGLNDYGDKKMESASDIVVNRKNSVRSVQFISRYFFESKFSFFAMINYLISYLIFRFNMNLIIHIFKRNKFVH